MPAVNQQSPTSDSFVSPLLVSPATSAKSDEMGSKESSASNAVKPASSKEQPPAYVKEGRKSTEREYKDYVALFGSILTGDANEVTRDTLDESKRDLDGISAKLQTVLSAGQAETDAVATLKEWDLWGPLISSLLLAMYLLRLTCSSLSHRAHLGSSMLFETCFLLIWGGSVAIYGNARLLGHQASLMHTICYLGYSVFPLALVSALGMVVPFAIINTLLVGCAVIWSISASAKFFNDPQLETKRLLVNFPLLLYYFTIAWLCIIT